MARDRVLFQRGDDFRTLDTWGLVLCEAPIQLMSDVKEPYKNEWPDEHGDEEWADVLYYQSYELELTMATRSVLLNTTAVEVRAFVEWLAAGEFMLWVEHGNLGRQKVRYAGYEDDAHMWKQKIRTGGRDQDEWVLQFKIKLKVNDPVTRVFPNSTYTGLRVL